MAGAPSARPVGQARARIEVVGRAGGGEEKVGREKVSLSSITLSPFTVCTFFCVLNSHLYQNHAHLMTGHGGWGGCNAVRAPFAVFGRGGRAGESEERGVTHQKDVGPQLVKENAKSFGSPSPPGTVVLRPAKAYQIAEKTWSSRPDFLNSSRAADPVGQLGDTQPVPGLRARCMAMA